MERKRVYQQAAGTGMPEPSRAYVPEEAHKNCQRITMPEGDGDFLAFTIQDESMSPTLKPGNIVICSLFDNCFNIKDDEIYAVIAPPDLWIKRVKKHYSLNGICTHIELVSDNAESCPSFLLSMDQGLLLYKVRRKLSII